MEPKAKVSRVILKDIRSFPDLEIELLSPAGVKNWAVFLGNNGVGKSTILKSIALALGDRSHAAGLLQDFNGNLVRKGAKDESGDIRVEFTRFSSGGAVPYIDLSVKSLGDREEIIKYETEPKNFPWDKIFVTGYGAGRGVEGTESWSKYRASDSVYSLFQYTQPLQNSELVLRRVAEELNDRRPLLEAIDEIMMLPSGSTRLSKSGIVVKGPWGNELPLSALGDGYRATLAWVTDIIGWAMFIEEGPPWPRNISGVVLVDELDQHLHPIWQRRIIQLLAERFPNLQFFVTTHSPTIALGTTDLADDLCQIYLLDFDEENRAAAIRSEIPRGKRVDQILTSSLFGMFDTWDDGTREQIHRYAALAQTADSDARRSELDDLRKILTDRLGSGSSELETIVRQAVRQAIDRHFKKKLEGEALDLLKEAAEFEGQRQLSELDSGFEENGDEKD